MMDDVEVEVLKDLTVERMLGPVGIRPAMIGCRMSYKQAEKTDSTNYAFGDRDLMLAKGLYQRGDSHSAFLRMIWFWFEINAPLSFWTHFEKYKYVNRMDMDIEMRSESTMHTVLKSDMKRSDFTTDVPHEIIDVVNSCIDEGNFSKAIASLPKGFKQKRMVNMNMQTLLNIVKQRKDHRLNEWKIFIDTVLSRFPFLNEFLE